MDLNCNINNVKWLSILVAIFMFSSCQKGGEPVPYIQAEANSPESVTVKNEAARVGVFFEEEEEKGNKPEGGEGDEGSGDGGSGDGGGSGSGGGLVIGGGSGNGSGSGGGSVIGGGTVIGGGSGNGSGSGGGSVIGGGK